MAKEVSTNFCCNLLFIDQTETLIHLLQEVKAFIYKRTKFYLLPYKFELPAICDMEVHFIFFFFFFKPSSLSLIAWPAVRNFPLAKKTLYS